MVKEVIWPLMAQKQLYQAYEFILKDSFQNAKKVKNDILKATNELSENSEKYPIDKFRIDNNGSFRAFELHNFRTAYKITDI